MLVNTCQDFSSHVYHKSCVKNVNRPDSSPPRPAVTLGLAPFSATGSPSAAPPTRQPVRQLRHTREQELLSALQNDRVMLSRHRGCVNVWFGMWDRAVEDTGSGPGAVMLRKVALRSERAPHKLRQNPFFHVKTWSMKLISNKISCFSSFLPSVQRLSAVWIRSFTVKIQSLRGEPVRKIDI